MEAVRPVISPRADNAGQALLNLLANPFGSQLQQNSVFAALGSSLGITAAIAICFSFLRPYNSVVYAPKLKHADEKHTPPRLGKGVFAWVSPLWSTTEKEMIDLVGMDATIFLRFTRMCRNIFVVLTILCCSILIPINWKYTDSFTANNDKDKDAWLYRITPRNVWGEAQWANVVVAWVSTTVVCVFLWLNYRKVAQLRRDYYNSEEYQCSLHGRTLMVTDIPKKFSSDEGIARIIDGVVPSSSFSRTAIARDVKVLPALIEQHGNAVRKLEKVLARYLKDPQNLPAVRPMCLPSKKDPSWASYPKGQKLDAIDYLTQRIKSLELEIKEVRQRIDKRGSMPYGFASYADISEAHAIAYTCRKKRPHGAIITLAPRPNDIIWENMPLSSGVRSTKRLWNNLWITILTLLWIAPNAFIAIFLVNLSNLGNVWEGFRQSLLANPGFWSLVQGIASPALISLVYLLLPIIFRRMSMNGGDQTKTGRERHVVAKLYAFFVFNNLFVTSVFGAIWAFVTQVIKITGETGDAWKAILDVNIGATVFGALCQVSPFWVAWLLQRQLGAAVDLAQLWTLLYSFMVRKFSSPTPRELIELTAPPPFDYASYYNYFLFYSTVALCYGPIQPLVLPAAALYFSIDVALKKYLLLYIFITKTESGGMFWRVLFNRFLFGTILANLVVFLIVWVRGDGRHYHAYAVAPLPVLLIIFKIVCKIAFDDKIEYQSTRFTRQQQTEAGLNVKEQSQRNDRLAARFGHPALYKPLITPMVHAKAQNVLASVYQGRLSDGRGAAAGDEMSVSGYSDTIAMDSMLSGKAGKVSPTLPGFEVVPESRLDFEFYKNRGEFGEDHGGGNLFGAAEIDRPDTPSTFVGRPDSRPGTPAGGMGFGAGRRVNAPYAESSSGPAYPQPGGYPSQSYFSPSTDIPSGSRTPIYNLGNDSGTNLMGGAALMPVSTPDYSSSPYGPGSTRDRTYDGASGGPTIPPGILGGGPRGYGNLPQTDNDYVQSPPNQDPTQYDYFRGPRRREHRDGSSGGGIGSATRSGSNVWGGN
ncbi:protein OSCA1 [Cladorrhinum sp. PSN332]|nr:protein OSCA1 [Cladorrhinum sp. PSN332]